jgi:regulator of nucleoside diphosphate kinase
MDDLNLPPITISAIDYDRLSRIASAGVHNQRYTVAEMLADELNRAMIAAPGAIRPDVVTMHSEVEYQDEVTGQTRRITLVYPGEEDSNAGRFSVLMAVGTALIGLSGGQSMEWQGPTGGRRKITLRRVHFQPERMASLGARIRNGNMPQGLSQQRKRRRRVKSENKILDTRESRNHRPAEAKAVVVPAWAPQPNPLTREEIRKLVIDQIG